MLVEIALWDTGLQEARLGGIASLVDSSGWDVPAGEAALPACAGCSQHTQVAKSLLAVDTELVVLCLTFSPTVSCQKPPARPCHDWALAGAQDLERCSGKMLCLTGGSSTPGTPLFLWDGRLPAHLCSLQECRDPGAFVNIGEPCTVH